MAFYVAGGSQLLQVETIPGRSRSVDIGLGRGAGRGLLVTVCDINDEPLPGITVSLNTGENQVTDSQGQVFFDVPGGTYTVSAELITGLIGDEKEVAF